MKDKTDLPARVATDGDIGLEPLLNRLLASEGFRRADRLRSLLRYLIDRAHLASGSAVKEYELGVEVFGRPVTYDPRTDPIVRVGMRELRMKLATYYAGDGATDPIRIEIPKGSYRVVFTCPAHADAVQPPVAPLLSPPDYVPEPGTSGQLRSWVVGAVLVVLAVIAIAATWRAAPAVAPPLTPSVAVLPFVNLSGDPDHDYFSDGITEEIMAALMGIEGLLVTGRTSAFSFKDRAAAPEEIGRTLGVAAILSGSVRLAGNELRIIARLTQCRDGFELWSRTFEGPAADPSALEIRLAAAVASALRIRLDETSGQPFVRRSNDNLRAHDLYFKARHLAHTRDSAKLRQSIELFEEAVRLDPGYALAHAGLADAHSVLASNGQVEPGVAIARARDAARRALALDPTLGEALAHLAYLSAFVDWQWADAEQAFKRALELAPSHSRIHAWFGQTLVAQGRFDEALERLATAQRLDPLASSISYAFGEAYLYAGRYDDALRQARRLLQMDQQSWGGHNLVARASMAAGRPVDALPSLARFHGQLWADALALVAEGHHESARTLIDRERASLETTQPFTVASLYASAGALDEALSSLERAYAMRQIDLVVLAVEPALKPLRSLPRFQAMVEELGLVSKPRLLSFVRPDDR